MWVQLYARFACQRREDRGDQITGYILITATAVTIALAVAAIFYDTLVEGASSIDLGVD